MLSVDVSYQSLGALFMFWENADRRACCGNIEDGDDTAADDEEDWVKKGGGGKERGENGN